MGMEITLSFSGKNLKEIAAQAAAFAASEGLETSPKTTTPKVETKPTKKAQAAEVETDDTDFDITSAGENDDMPQTNEDDFLSMGSDDEDEQPAAKKAPTKKKLTDKDVNAAAIAHARATSKKETLKILEKKFKVKSILELKPDQYEAVIKALEV